MAQYHVDPKSGDAGTLRKLISATQHLSDEYHIWHSIPLKGSKHKIDLAILHPRFGLWLLNIINWKSDQISHVDREYCTVQLLNKEGQLPNPLTQARQLHGIIKRALCAKSELIHSDGKFSGNLIFPVHHIVVFSEITNKELTDREYDVFFPYVQRMTADELAEIENTKRIVDLLLQKRSPRILNYNGLGTSQIKVIHHVLFPDMSPFQAIKDVVLKPEETMAPQNRAHDGSTIAPESKQPEFVAAVERDTPTQQQSDLSKSQSKEQPADKAETAPSMDSDQLSDYEEKLLFQSQDQREVFVYNQSSEVEPLPLQNADSTAPQSEEHMPPILRSLDNLVKNNYFLLKYIWSRKQ